MDKIDLELTQSLGQAVSTMYSVLGAVGAICAATKGTLLVACKLLESGVKVHL